MTFIRGSLDHTIMNLNQEIMAHQVIQDPFTVTHQQSEERMVDREHNTQRVDRLLLTLYHLLRCSDTVFASTIGSGSFQTSVTVFQVYLRARLCQHSRPPHCLISFANWDISLLQESFPIRTLTLAWNDSTEAFTTGSSASQHSDVTVRLFESDTRMVEPARLAVHSTGMCGNSTRFHADFTAVVVLSVTVDLVSTFLLRCPGKSYLRCRQMTSTQCTQFTHERLNFAHHGGESDGIDLSYFVARFVKKSRLPHLRSSMLPPPLWCKTDWVGFISML